MRKIFTLILMFAVSLGFAQQATGSDKASAFEVTYQSTRIFPNPVVSNATFEFKLTSPAKVQVTLLNILGAQIKNIINDNRPAGNQNVQFSADQLQRGTYFVRLSINGEIVKTVRVAVAPQ